MIEVFVELGLPEAALLLALEVELFVQEVEQEQQAELVVRLVPTNT